MEKGSGGVTDSEAG